MAATSPPPPDQRQISSPQARVSKDAAPAMTEYMATRAHQTQLSDIPDEIVATCKRLMLDAVAVGMAGSNEAPIRRYMQFARGMEGAHTVMNSSQRLPAINAAVVNGMMMHVLDYEPMWHPPTHACSPLLPALLVASEVAGTDGGDLIRAFAIGLELQGRLRVGSETSKNVGSFVQHPPGFVGTISAALGCGILLGLGPEQLRHAVGIACSRTGGLMGNVGTDMKCMHCGLAAGNGLESALLARDGFRANPCMLEHPRGFLADFYPDGYDVETAVSGFLSSDAGLWRVHDPGFALKYFPAHFAMQFVITNSIELFGQMRACGEDACTVESVIIHAPRYDYVDRPRPSTGIEGKFSMQFCAAVALVDGDVDLSTFHEAATRRPEVLEMLGKVRIEVDEGRRSHLTDMELHITVRTAKSVYLSTNPTPLGHWRCTSQKTELTKEKAARCFRHIGVLPERAERISAAVLSMETASAHQLKAFLLDLGRSSRL